MQNFKKIGSVVLELWRRAPPPLRGGAPPAGGLGIFFVAYAPLQILENLHAKFHENQFSSFGVMAQTDTQTQTHRHTDIQTDRQTHNAFL